MATFLAIDHIVATPGVCGGKPRINGTRMRVEDVAMYHSGGMTVDDIVEDFGLTPAQVYAALAYYHDHKDEIDRDIAEGKAFAEQFLAEGKARQSSVGRDEIVRRMKELQKKG